MPEQMMMVLDEALTLADETGDYLGLYGMAHATRTALLARSEAYTADFRDIEATLTLGVVDAWDLVCDWSLAMSLLIHG